MGSKVGFVRGQPNYKRKVKEYLEKLYAEDPTFEDCESNSDFHETIIRNLGEEFEAWLNRDDFTARHLNWRNFEGKTPLMLCLQHGR